MNEGSAVSEVDATIARNAQIGDLILVFGQSAMTD